MSALPSYLRYGDANDMCETAFAYCAAQVHFDEARRPLRVGPLAC